MLGKSHMIVGGASGAITGAALGAPLSVRIVMVGVGVFGGLVPDADTHSSILGKRLPGWWHDRTPGHRGITHSLFWCIFIYAMTYLVQRLGVEFGWWEQPEHSYIPVALAYGALSHVLADSLTTQGVPLFYPLKWRFRPLMRWSFTTGTKPEGIAVFVILAITTGYVLYPIMSSATVGIYAPQVQGFSTMPAIVFVGTALGAALVMWGYLMTNTASERARHERRRARRAQGRKPTRKSATRKKRR